MQTPLGEVRLRSDGEALIGLWFVGQVNDAKDHSDIKIKDDLSIFVQVENWLEHYFSGEETPITIPLQPKGTIFQERVWKILQEIPYGETMTYGDIAQRIAKEKGVATYSAQAVGQAVGKNPISILIPCHRVLGRNGALTGYAGGVHRKEQLLHLERGKEMVLKGIKMILAAFGSLLVAQYFGLSSASVASIIAILSVGNTKKSSIVIAWKRIVAMLLALTVAVCVFLVMGHSTISFGVYLIIYIPLAFLLKAEAGIAPSSVLAIHLWLSQTITNELLLNEALLMLVGTAVALLLNWHMPSYQQDIEDKREEIEDKLKDILRKMAYFLRMGNGTNDAKLIIEAKEKLAQAQKLLFIESENQLFSQFNKDLCYFEMRAEQIQLLEVMAKNLNDFHCPAREAELLAEMFDSTAEQLHLTNTGLDLMDEIQDYIDEFRNLELPKTRDEFEYRATLFQLLRDLQRFIDLKVCYFRDHH